MSTPTRPIPRKFYRVAYQRFEEAEVLFEAGYYIGAVYLAGYAVECMLKTLILEATPEKDHATVEAEFRGQRAHHYEWLRQRYVQTHAPGLPADIGQRIGNSNGILAPAFPERNPRKRPWGIPAPRRRPPSPAAIAAPPVRCDHPQQQLAARHSAAWTGHSG